MIGGIVTFTSLYPSALLPTHGLFVRERMRRVAAAAGRPWQVVAPVPAVPWPLRRKIDRVHGAMPEREVVDGVLVFHPRYFHLPGLSMARQARRVARAALPQVRALVAEGPCVLDAHYVYPDGVAALMIAAELGIPCIVTARGSDLNVLAGYPVVARQIRATAPRAQALLAVSEPLRRRFCAIAGVAEDRVRLARNGVDLELFHPGDRLAARRQLGLPERVALCCAVGRLVPQKGFHLMAKALRQLPDRVHFAVAGDGPERARLAQIAPPGRLHLLGARPPAEVATLYRASDLMVLPSEREGWPNVVTEALASGVPVVATAVGGIPDILTSPHVGSLVRVGDAAALAREVARFLEMPKRPEMIRRFAERFAWDEPVRLIARCIDEALGPAAGAAAGAGGQAIDEGEVESRP